MCAGDVAAASCAWDVTESALTHAESMTWANTPPFYVSDAYNDDTEGWNPIKMLEGAVVDDRIPVKDRAECV